MDYKEFRQIIDKDIIESVYLFTGTEEYIMNRYMNYIKNKYIDENFETLNYIEIDKNHSFEDLFNACETLPFMSDKKLVLVKDLNEFIKEDKKNRDKLNDYIDEINSDIILILKDKNDKLNKNTKLYKSLKKLNRIINFERLNSNDLSKWILSLMSSKNKSIYGNNLNYLVQRTGYLEYKSEKSLFEIENEILKIIDYSENKEISKEDIDSNLVEDLDTNIFNFLDQIINKNMEGALNLLDDMYRANEPLGRIFYMITRQFRLLLQYITLNKRGYNEPEMRSKMKISPYEFKKIRINANRYNEKLLKDKLEYMLELDVKQKTSSQNEKLAMELLIVELTK